MADISSPLKGKHIVLGITGGIAAYKSAALLRLLVKAGAEVQVVMTPAAREFITSVTLSALSGRPVVSEFFNANSGEWHSHVDLGLWADVMIIAPATACTIAKMTHGVADNMLVTTYLSAREPVFIAPAMDLDMMAHPTTQRNLRQLQADGVKVIEPEVGELASHLVGKGRMEEPEKIFATIEAFFASQKVQPQVQSLNGKRILITAGPTREPIDPVRYISNYSTGKMAYAIAEEAAHRGAKVTIVSGPVEVKTQNPSIDIIPVTTGKEMYAACMEQFPSADIAVMCAAVADYTVANPSPTKIKREHSAETPKLILEKNPDIAASLGLQKRGNQLLVGFALETDHVVENAREKMARKNLDIIVANSLQDPGAGFATDTNKVTIYTAGKPEGTCYPLKAKTEVAKDILDAVARLL